MKAATSLRELLSTRKVVVCCGAGGVGKTTTAAALGVATARMGRRVLVLTIDPARRLAQALGIDADGREPVSLPADKLAQAGIQPPGELHAWMLNPRVVFENLITRLAESPEAARRVLDTALFGHLSRLVAGMQEYTAAEALYELSTSGRYDLVVLDTPPSRNALDFLDAPGRLSRFLDERILALFLPERPRFVLLRKAAERVTDVLTRIFGEHFLKEMQEFLVVSRGLFGPMRRHADEVRKLLSSSDATFLLVTTSEEAALAEARYFRARLAALKLPFAGFVLNRSWAFAAAEAAPWDLKLPASAPLELQAGLRKLEGLARQEKAWADRDRAFMEDLRRELSADGLAVATPDLGDSLDDVRGLASLAESLAAA
ncbi:MAG TPA: ArsA-related P-loop ATPase [Myxococcaceae bacterium]|nr:ArsA-related P-loop ATPase [Myxococcaceae bacterium]